MILEDLVQQDRQEPRAGKGLEDLQESPVAQGLRVSLEWRAKQDLLGLQDHLGLQETLLQ